jgi:hypothetical protein
MASADNKERTKQMSKKDYERAAELVQTARGIVETRGENAGCKLMESTFVLFFMDDNPRFDEARFRAACVPGANVKARGKKVA